MKTSKLNPITLLALINVIISKLFLLIVVTLFLPFISDSNQPWYKVFKDSFITPESENPTPLLPPDDKRSDEEYLDSKKRLSLLALVLFFDMTVSGVLMISLLKKWFYGLWPWMVFRIFLGCGLYCSAFVMILQNFTMSFQQCNEWDLINVLNIIATVIFINVYVVYRHYCYKTEGPPLPRSSSSPASPHHPMYSIIEGECSQSTVTLELDDVVSTKRLDDDKYSSKCSSFWDENFPPPKPCLLQNDNTI